MSSAKLDHTSYRALKTEQGVFTTPPYSGELKSLWRFKDASTAEESAQRLFERFQQYRDNLDFIGMDVTRKFIQMGRTRSLRYALRKGGKKYEYGEGETSSTRLENEEGKVKSKKEIPRTGKVYDQSKLEGADIFEGYLNRCWNDDVYKSAWKEWKEKERGTLYQSDQGTQEQKSGRSAKRSVKRKRASRYDETDNEGKRESTKRHTRSRMAER